MTVTVFGPFSDRKALEATLQEWLNQNSSITIRFVAQSQDGAGWITITVFV
jgi:hypothetical protein